MSLVFLISFAHLGMERGFGNLAVINLNCGVFHIDPHRILIFNKANT